MHMTEQTILSASGYLPLLRFDRSVARSELRWAGMGGARGHRAVAGWDEDALTLAIEASRLVSPESAGRVTVASTSSPFTDRSMAGLLVDALTLDPALPVTDVGLSRRAATSALIRALASDTPELIAAGERRQAQAGSPQGLAWGDGAGAVLVGPGEGLARCRAAVSRSAQVIDSYTAMSRGLPYGAEDRFVRDTAVDLYQTAVSEALDRAGVAAGDVAIAAMAEPVAGTYIALAKAMKLKAPNLCTEVAGAAGDLGAAMPLFGLALALDRAQPGDLILVAGFGNGCDVLLLEATGTGNGSAEAALSQGSVLSSYTRFLNLTGGIDLDWGPRAEVNQKVSASTLARHSREMTGFVGGRDQGGNVQFPKTPMPVNPAIEGLGAYEDVVLRDVPAKVASITADRLNYTPDPPFHFGLVQFENGARVMMEHCDTDCSAPAVGDPVRMRFRIKAMDRQRAFRTYFWKAAPAERPTLAKEG